MAYRFLSIFFTGLMMMATSAFADDPGINLTIRNRQFMPQQLAVPPNTKVALLVSNEDSLPMEFESYDLSTEVIVPSKSKVKIYIGPLTPGQYVFFNDFNRAMRGAVQVILPAKAGG